MDDKARQIIETEDAVFNCLRVIKSDFESGSLYAALQEAGRLSDKLAEYIRLTDPYGREKWKAEHKGESL